MSSKFDAHSTADQVLEGIDLTNRTVFVTGATSGIGLETARSLVARGATVIGTGRDIVKNRDVLDDAAKRGGGRFDIIRMDLADLASVRSVAADMRERALEFDAVGANAGVMNTPFGHTADAFETQFGTNFIGHFVLLNELAPIIRDNGRVVILSSSAHRFADVDLDDPNFEDTPYDPTIAYGRSKTADALLAVGFDERHKDRGIRAAAVHPGVIPTDLSRYTDPEQLEAAIAAMQEEHVALGNEPFVPKNTEQGAATSVWVAFVADGNEIGGKYCEDCGVSPVLDGENVGAFAPGVFPYALDSQRADALWSRASQMVDAAN